MSSLTARILLDAQKRCAPSTVRKYTRAVKVINRAIGQVPVAEITGARVFQLLDELRDKPAAANHVHSVLRLVFRYAVTAGLLDHSPIADIPRYRQGARDRYLTDAEFDQIKAAGGVRLRLIADLCYLTAQRISDVLAIRREDCRAGGIEFKQQKTGIRLFIKAPGLPAVIRRAKRINRHSAYLIGSANGSPIDYPGAYRLWRRACARAGIENANLHDIRAKSVTDAERQGLDPTALAGHTNTAQTRRYLRGRSIKTVNGPKEAK